MKNRKREICTSGSVRDEDGQPPHLLGEVGNQVLVSSHRKLLWSKAMVVSVAENRNEIPAGKIERGERKQTVGEVSKAFR